MALEHSLRKMRERRCVKSQRNPTWISDNLRATAEGLSGKKKERRKDRSQSWGIDLRSNFGEKRMWDCVVQTGGMLANEHTQGKRIFLTKMAWKKEVRNSLLNHI